MAKNDRENHYEEKFNRLTQEYFQLQKRFGQQQEMIEQMKKELEYLKSAVRDLTAKNIRIKPNKPNSNTFPKKTPSDHAKTSRKRAVRIDAREDVDQKTCDVCGFRLSKIVDSYTRGVEDIIPARTHNIEYAIHRRYCKRCGKTVTPKIHTALPNDTFGIRLGAFLISLKTLGLSYQKISGLVATMFSLYMIESTVNHVITKTAGAFGPLYGQMIEELKLKPNIHGTRPAGG